ncbi:hypothetical protein [Streptomyces sp. XY413]|uniref:hypothetical protein n=1 Tax=Streptomyces sp. XY413 TaxID=1519479 RepID=UPI00131A79F9|nr:hypothetical protein [Streptomyces sp. XY413]
MVRTPNARARAARTAARRAARTAARRAVVSRPVVRTAARRGGAVAAGPLFLVTGIARGAP